MKAIDGELLRRFLLLAGDRLEGDWVIIGGVVLPLLGIEHRATVDIDIAGPEGSGADDTITLFEIAEELDLPVESINPAAAFFLRRIPGWRENLVPIHRGRRARILVPDPTLFVLLKIDRLTEADLSDCLAMLDLARRRGSTVDEERLRKAAREAASGKASPARTGRLGTLHGALAGQPG